jgi:hypothetical protein
MDYVQNPEKFWTLFHKEVKNDKGEVVDTTIDLGLMYKAINYALNASAFENALIDKGKSLGTQKEVDDIHNIPKNNGQSSAAPEKLSLHEAFKRKSVEVPLGG